jgi:fructose-bisphosphate aldolase, class II
MPNVAESPADLLASLGGVARIADGRLVIDDEARFRSQAAADLAWTAAFTKDDPTAEAARWIVWEASQALGARSASIHDLYMARGRGEVSGFTVPAINIRAQTFDMARTFFETALRADVGAVIFELARSEQTYTFQRPMDYATFVLAGAIAAGWRHPVFIQGDHYQFNAKKYAADPEAMTEEIRRACRLAVDAGYRNIDIDSSTLVDLSKPDRDEEQRENYVRAAELTAVIRGLETDGVTISVGGEIGEVGKQNSTADELEAYLDGYDRELARRAPGAVGLSKVSVQTGTSHGGVPLPGGGVAEVKLDFEVLRTLGEIARARGLAGAVQHGASTLPDELYHHFPAVETAEIHLATGFQNALYEHPAFPASLMDEIYAWCEVNAADERKDGQTDEQFLYTTRKKAIGPFKRQLWDLDTRGEILAAQGTKLGFLFTELRVNGSMEMVERFVRPVPLSRPIPESLTVAVPG